MIKKLKINPKELPFNIKTREACKACKRYGLKATCPPYIESFDYYSNFRKYKYGRIYYTKTKIDNIKNWKQIGQETSLKIHKFLLKIREKLLGKNHYFCVILGAGSCKLCKDCSFPCRHPELSIIPLEATGIDVVKLMKKHKVNITFPVKNFIYRIGLVLYD